MIADDTFLVFPVPSVQNAINGCVESAGTASGASFTKWKNQFHPRHSGYRSLWCVRKNIYSSKAKGFVSLQRRRWWLGFMRYKVHRPNGMRYHGHTDTVSPTLTSANHKMYFATVNLAIRRLFRHALFNMMIEAAITHVWSPIGKPTVKLSVETIKWFAGCSAFCDQEVYRILPHWWYFSL